MDNKTVALVGALLVLGVAIYGMATGNVPGFSQFGEEESPEENNAAGDGTTGDGTENVNSQQNNDDGGGNTTEGGGNESEGNEELQELAERTGLTEDELREMDADRVEELLRRTELTEVCENQGEDYEPEQGNVMVRGPPFNPFMFESMVHNEMNDMRESRTDAESLNCDPVLREIAREHSEAVVEGEEINETSVRYEGVCEEPRETSGNWYYLRDMELNPPEGSNNQRLTVIENHDDMLREVRFYLLNNAMEGVEDRSATRQGVGAYINNENQEVVVTHVVC
jgi:hypothetical protein